MFNQFMENVNVLLYVFGNMQKINKQTNEIPYL